MIYNKILNLANNKLKERKIVEVIIGAEMLGVVLDDGSAGVSYVLSNEVKSGCLSIPEAGQLEGREALEIAQWFIDSKNIIKSSLGLAVINASIDMNKISNYENKDAGLAVDINKEDIVTMVGFIKPIIDMIEDKCKKIKIYDRGKEGEGFNSSEANIDIIKKSDIMYITSTSLINHTLHEIIEHAENTREIILTGPSTPLMPEAFRDTAITKLAGMKWLPENNSKLLKIIAQAGGMKQFAHLGEKISLQV